MSKITIRKYTTDDEAALKSITKNANRQFIEDLEDGLKNNSDKYIVAEYNRVVAGYLYANLSKGNNPIFIYVTPEHRRCGIGTALYNEAERQVREKGENELYSRQYYEYETGKGFADKLGCQLTTGSVYMIKTDGIILPETMTDKIRKYREKDAVCVHQIVARAFHALNVKLGFPDYMCVLHDEINEDRRREYNSIAAGSYVLEDGGQIVGFGNIDGKNIGSLAVDMTMNNKGYGKALAVFMTNEILRQGNKTAELWCEVGNDNALHLYKKLGYREVESAYWSCKKFE